MRTLKVSSSHTAAISDALVRSYFLESMLGVSILADVSSVATVVLLKLPLVPEHT